MEVPERRWFCVCGFNVADNADREAKLLAHRESGEHGTMMKVNALRASVAELAAAVEREIEEV